MPTRRDGIFGKGSDGFLSFFRAERKAKGGSCGEELKQNMSLFAREVSGTG